MTKFKLGIISLGCDKNRVDTEIILGTLKDKFDITNNPKLADVIIVNTCGFIESSKQESIDTILEMAEYKTKHNCKILIATGCLTQRYKEELLELMPEIDIIAGVNDYPKLSSAIEEFYNNHEKILLCSDAGDINEGERIITTGQRYAYLRISEGCNNNCTYCAIPKIRGPYRSRKLESIIKEAQQLVSNGIQEIIIIAQDTTLYGIDIYGKKVLPQLIDEISKISGIRWIRLLYCYPEEITDELIHVIATNPKVCKYLDMPIQHISSRVLKLMGRKGTKESITNVINKLKSNIKNIALRTTFIVGFPGETNEDFNELFEFVSSTGFDHMGVFQYSPEEGTAAAKMKNYVADDIKESRERQLMLEQQKVSLNNNKNKLDNIYETLIEDINGEYLVGRTQHMAPGIDGVMLITPDKRVEIGDFVLVRVRDVSEYDLVGDVCYESCE